MSQQRNKTIHNSPILTQESLLLFFSTRTFIIDLARGQKVVINISTVHPWLSFLSATDVINAISLTVLFRVDRVGGSLQLLRLRQTEQRRSLSAFSRSVALIPRTECPRSSANLHHNYQRTGRPARTKLTGYHPPRNETADFEKSAVFRASSPLDHVWD